ncbi:MarR family winged helix-turn-helix transcriptional regulator [Vibrio scophthalmi]|uniref:MarR family transcriptional regulator n=1 Tax=Vibrio scophthalmi LMG 19158 TaxID=870967 RepID=F9RRV5_9VIBR|nr:winged helix DNA-binding protein [Vibrio scophthalmi]EGU32785.1 MarR family transcriptional regulator [Vibrio scophthalmi LMG 19158]
MKYPQTKAFGLIANMVANKSRMEFSRELKKQGVSIKPEQSYMISLAAKNNGSVAMSEFTKDADFLGDKSRVSKMIKELIDSGYCIRQEDPDDRRYMMLKLTNLGLETEKKIAEAYKIRFSVISSEFSDHELEEFRAYLLRFLNILS